MLVLTKYLNFLLAKGFVRWVFHFFVVYKIFNNFMMFSVDLMSGFKGQEAAGSTMAGIFLKAGKIDTNLTKNGYTMDMARDLTLNYCQKQTPMSAGLCQSFLMNTYNIANAPDDKERAIRISYAMGMRWHWQLLCLPCTLLRPTKVKLTNKSRLSTESQKFNKMHILAQMISQCHFIWRYSAGHDCQKFWAPVQFRFLCTVHWCSGQMEMWQTLLL